MNIKIIASTKVGYALPKEEAVNFSGKSAGICYLPDTVETLFNEPIEKTERRVNGNLKNGHHSVFGHPIYNLCLEGIPKILAMILNNEKLYNTSEKSARYTHMEPSDDEKELYEKWIEIYKKQILKTYPNFEEKKAKKLAQENARYLISVFTPATIMEYTVDFRQLNYIIGWSKDYIENVEDNPFSIKLKKALKEFLYAMPDIEVEGLNSKEKGRSFSLFAKRERYEEFGENYSTNYKASFAELAQAQRHRTIYYEFCFTKEPEFFIPPIIKGTELEKEWINDITSLKGNFPQGMLININERGTIENFVLKCMERLCGAAQLEIMQQTKKTMDKYMNEVKDKPELYNYLLPYSKGARCTFPHWKCNSPCVFGGKNALTRLI
jgi:thymidylate synthase ThyX